jgi:hypothetical protein
VASFKQRLLRAIGRPEPKLDPPSATEPRAGYMSYTMRMLVGDRYEAKRRRGRRDTQD